MTSFEDNYEMISREIAKRKSKWNLSAINWMDFDDVTQIIKIHIHKKWTQYDETKSPLINWLNRIISNQIKNLLRNNYGNFSRPCLKCPLSQGEDLCSLYGTQSSSCSLFAKWEKSKQPAYQTKLPLPIENHWSEVNDKTYTYFDVDKASKNLHAHMETVLKPTEWKAYKMLYVDELSDDEVAKEMGFKTNEEKRAPGYKQLQNLKKIILLKVKKSLSNENLDIV
jgi:RNA polymerase sigma factor (sigma-70 family)